MNIYEKHILNTWTEYTLENDHGMSVSVLNYGGIITRIMTLDRVGKKKNIVLGYKNKADYEENPNFFGALIGPVAGRIAGASFEIDGNSFSLEKNEDNHHLHGGPNGLHQIVWDVVPFQTADTTGLKLTHTLADGEDDYPGNVEIAVTYTLNNANEFAIDYWARTDQATPLALTNHTYFNLSGDLKHTVHDHHVTFDSAQFVELDSELIPTGNKLGVSGTTFDFRNGRMLGDGFETASEQHIIADNGYDHYFTFEKEGKVVVNDKASGRVLTIQTDQPGMVVYTANGLDDGLELAEGSSRKHLGVCFETQGSPASLHHEGFPSVILQAGETYNKRTVFSFHTAD